MLLIIALYQVGGMDLFNRFPRVVTIGVSDPLNQILKLFPSSCFPMSHDTFHLILFFSIY
jgi:hypothetical protein